MAMKPGDQGVEAGGFDTAKLYLWIKGLEGKVNNLLREMNVLKNDSLKKSSQMRSELKSFNEDLLELKRELVKTSEKMDLIIKELQNTAGIEEVTTLKKYIEYWNPMMFVTQKDVEKIVEQQLQKHAQTKVTKEKHK